MLNVYFGAKPEMIIDVDAEFDFNYEDEWFDDPFVRAMIKDVDQSDVVSAYAIKSPVLGMIAPTMISGGVKALILMLKEDFIIWGTACGDNCSKWIIEIAKQKDFTICLEHVMNFPEEFEPVRILNNDHIVTTDKDMFREAIKLVHS